MMSEISYHQQQYIRHQKREKKLVLFLRIFILLFFLVLWEISARTGLIDSFIFSSPVMIWHSFCSMCRDCMAWCQRTDDYCLRYVGCYLWFDFESVYRFWRS